MRLRRDDDVVDDAVLLGLVGGHDEVAVGVVVDALDRLEAEGYGEFAERIRSGGE